jgi:hypothetical protein
MAEYKKKNIESYNKHFKNVRQQKRFANARPRKQIALFLAQFSNSDIIGSDNITQILRLISIRSNCLWQIASLLRSSAKISSFRWL